jgi:hypothetical protein
MDEMNDVPIIPVPGSDSWSVGYRFGEILEKSFPGQGGSDFAMAISENEFPPYNDKTVTITDLKMFIEGQNDESSWVWYVEGTFPRSRNDGSTYPWTIKHIVVGWCDYTGWDCQSGIQWLEIN